MKINIKKLFANTLFVIIIFGLFIKTNQQCSTNSGCIQRNKFITYVTSISLDGEISKDVSDVNYKIIYLLKTGISIVDSTNPNDKILENEVGINYGTNASRIVRKIPYSQIVLDCGKFRNKLCEVGNYPDKDRLIKAKEGIKKSISENIESNCIVIPFFEFGYSDPQDKIALLCLPESKDLYDIIKFRDFLSTTIELIQIKEADNKASTFNAIERPVHKCITYNAQKLSVAVSTQIKQNKIYMWNEDSTWVKNYSLYEQKNPDGFACPVTAALAKKPEKLSNWNLGLKPQPKADCCLFLGGESQDLLICIADDSGSLEINDEVCKSELKEINRELHDFIYRVKILNAFNTLEQDDTKRKTCSNAAWNVMRNRLQTAAEWALENCKKFFTFVLDSKDNKTEKCKNQYLFALEHEEDFLTRKTKKLEPAFKLCVKAQKKELYDPQYLEQKIVSFGGSDSISFFFKQKENSISNKTYFDKLYPFFDIEEFDKE